ncbi:MAG: glycosyltransferase family 39 protein, partial [Candidatus Geothermincolia bacterium]
GDGRSAVIVLKVLGAIVSMLLMFVVPGFALFKSRLFREFGLHWLARVLFIIAVSAALTSLVALLLAEAGFMRMWLLDLILAIVAVAVRLVFGYTSRPVFLGARRREVLAVAALAIIGAGLFFRPFEVVMGDGDPGYYFNMGFHLARTGEMTVYDTSIPAMTPQELDTFFLNDVAQFMPFHLRVRQTGKIQPLLYHMLPVWIGMFIAAFGTWGGFYVLPLLMLLSVLAVYSLVRRYTNAMGAAAAALLMEFSFLVIYFARMPVSEAGCQFFLLVSLLFYAEYFKTKGPATGIAAAGAATVAFLFRPEALLLAVPMLIVEGVEVFRGRIKTGDIVFTNLLFAGLIYNWFYMRYVAYFYLSTNMGRVFRVFGTRNGMRNALDLFLAFIILAAVLFNLPFLRRLCARLGGLVGRAAGSLRARSGRITSAAMAVLTMLVFIYLYARTPMAKLFVESSKRFFFYMAGYFGGVSIFIFAIGLCLYIYQSRNTGFSFVLAGTLILLTAAFAESGVTSGYQPWLTRRFMTLLVPALFVGVGYLLGKLWGAGRLYLRVAAVLAAALVLAFFVYMDLPLFNFVQYKGVNKQIGKIAREADGDLVVFTDPFDGEAIGVPLRFQYGVDARRAFNLDAGADFAGTVRDYAAKGRKVLIETSGLSTLNPDPALLDKVSFVKAFDAEVSFDRLAQSYKVIPRRIGKETHDISFYYAIPK